MHFSSIHYGESDEPTNVTPAAVPELAGFRPASLVVLTAEQQHCSAQPGSSTGTLPPPAALCPAAGHVAMTVVSPAQEQPQSDIPALLCSQMRPAITAPVLSGLKKLQPLQARQALQDDCNASGLLTSPAMT